MLYVYGLLDPETKIIRYVGKTWAHVNEPFFKPRKAVKLTKENVIEIRSLLNENISQTEIAIRYSIDPSTVSNIKTGKRRKNVKSTVTKTVS